MSLFIHLANLIYLGSYAVRDLLWLRCLTCCALCLGATYFATRPEPLLAPVIWQSVSAAINFVQILLILDRRRLQRSDDYSECVFSDLSRDQMLVLLRCAA